MKVRIYRINKELPLPTYACGGDAGIDIYASEDVFFEPNEIKLVRTGIIAEAPEGFHFKLALRSSMARKRGFMLANGVGIIDSQFCGEQDEIQVLLKAPNSGFEIKTEWERNEKGFMGYRRGCWIKTGERIAQLILEKNQEIEWEEQEERNFKGSSRGGFGSSGK